MNREFALAEAEAMAPLARRVVQDLTEAYARVTFLRHRSRNLRALCKSSDYRLRQRSHRITGELASAEEALEGLYSELTDLGVELLDPVQGTIGFPFYWAPHRNSDNLREAYFLLRLCDHDRRGLWSWRFQDEDSERRIPGHWRHRQANSVSADQISSTPE